MTMFKNEGKCHVKEKTLEVKTSSLVFTYQFRCVGGVHETFVVHVGKQVSS